MAPKNIIVAFDGSAGGAAALRFAAENLLRTERGDSLTVLSVNVVPDDYEDIMEALLGSDAAEGVASEGEKNRLVAAEAKFAETMIAKAETELSAAGVDPKSGKGGKWTLVHEPVTVKREDPRDVISEYVETKKPDVLVVGSRGMGAVRRLMIGSVSDHLVHNASCPVLVVKEPNQG
ncbi:hypothetical protein DFJ74DRAFT_688382 [Hyaloraphidium curvatum]|nr:hypothetical protein DFJ74DRAFT_688382 [Hyaloraphidium curvatum]